MCRYTNFLLVIMLVATFTHAADTSIKIESDWGSGFIAKVKIDNSNSNEDLVDWTLKLEKFFTIEHMWNAGFIDTGDGLEISPLFWNERVPAGNVLEFGFLASPGNINKLPTLSLTPQPSPTPSPPIICSDNWLSLSIQGLEQNDTITIHWNPDWYAGIVGDVGNVDIQGKHFGTCAPIGQIPEFSFEIIDAKDYQCIVDDTAFALVDVFCSKPH